MAARLNRPGFLAALGKRVGNKNIMNSQSMFKINFLPQHKQIEAKKLTSS